MKVIQLLQLLPLASAFSTLLQKSVIYSSSELYNVKNEASSSSRRTFLSTTAILSTVITCRPLPSLADDLDDLAMPSEEEQKVRDVSG
jgi:hypothetical protein